MTVLDLGVLRGYASLDTASFDSAYTRVLAKLQGLSAEAKKSAAGVTTLDDSFATTAASADKAGAALSRVQSTTTRTATTSKEAADAAAQQATAQERVNAVLGQYAVGGARVQASALRMVAAEERLATVRGDETATTRQLASAQATLISSQRSLDGAQAAGAASSSRFGGALAGTLKTAASLGVVFGAFEAIKKAIDIGKQASAYQQQMTQIRNLTGATTQETRALNAALLGMSGRVATGPQDLATSAYHAESALRKLGATAPQIYATVATAAKGAKIGQTGLEDTTNALTATMASGIMSYKDAGRAMGSLLAIVGAGDMKVSDLNSALSTGLLVTMKVFGVSLRDTGAALAVFGDNNIRGSEAATKLRMSVQDLAKPAATAGPILASIGLSADKLRASLEKGGLNGALELLSRHMANAGIVGNKVGGFLEDAFTKKAGAGLAILLTRMDQFHSAQTLITKGANSFGSEWSRLTKTVGFQFQKLGAEADSAGIALMQKLQPALASSAHWLGVTVPHAIGQLMSILSPLAHEVGGALVTAWHGLDAVLRVAGATLSGVGRFLDENRGLVTGLGTATLTMWAAWKGYQIVTTAVTAIRAAYQSLLASGRNVGDSMARLQMQSGLTAAVMQRDLLATARADLESQATSEKAAAQKAEALANWARQSDATSVQVIADYEAEAAAAQAMADATAGALATVAAEADAAAADVTAASDAAAVSWGAMLGPIGLVAVGVGAFATALMHSSSAAKIDTAEVQSLTSAIVQNNGALTGNVELQVRQALLQAGAYDQARKLGISLQTVTRAALDGGPALADLTHLLKLYSVTGYGVSSADSARARTARALLSTLTGQNVTVKTAVKNANELKDGTIKGTAATKDGTAATRQAVAQWEAANKAIAKEVTQMDHLLDRMAKYAQSQLANAQSQDQFLESVDGVTKQLKGNSDSLGINTARGLANRDAFLNSVSAALSYRDAQKQAGVSTSVATKTLSDNIAQLRNAAIAAGANKSEVDKLLSSLHLLPHRVNTVIEMAHLRETMTALDSLQNKISYINSHGLIITTTVIDPTSGLPHGNTGRANGGGLPEGVSSVGERGPELAIKRGGHVDILSNSQSKAYIAATGIRAPGFAGGTGNERRIWDYLRGKGLAPDVTAGIMGNLERESGFSPTASNPSGHYGIAQWGGGRWVALNALAAREGKSPWSLGPQLDYLWQELTGPYRSVLTAIESARGARLAAGIFNRQFEVSGDYGGARAGYASDILSQFRGTGGGGGGGTGSGSGSGGGITVVGHGKNKQWRYGGILYQSLSAAQNAQTRDQQSSAKQVRQQQRQDALSFAKEIRALPSAFDSVKNANAALRPMLRELSHLGIPKGELERLNDQRDRLDKLIRRDNQQTKDMQAAHAKWRAALQHMHADQHGFASAARSGFDVTTAGTNANGQFSIGRFRAQQTQYVNLLHRWVRDFHKIVPIFKKTPSGVAMLRALAAGDPTQTYAEVSALAEAGPKIDREIIASQAEIGKITGQFGGYLGRQLDLPTVQRDRAQFERDKRLEHRTERAIDHATTRLEKGLARAFDDTMHNAVFGIEFIHGHWRAVRKDEKQHKKHRHVRKSS